MTPQAAGEILRFDVGGLACALPLPAVREVQRAVEVTPLPGAPAAIEGIVDLRGEVVPVVDLRERLSLPRVPVRASQLLIFLWTGDRMIAVRADQVAGIEPAAADDFSAASRLTRGPVEVAGVTRGASGLVLVHDAESLLRQAEAEALDRALADRGAS